MESSKSAVFAGGCFWCTEAVLQQLKGVIAVTPGYTGGETENPTYSQVCDGRTGHAEAVKVEYDSTIISYETLLAVFFTTHDPTSLNRQGADVGTQYRSVIFYADEEQQSAAESLIEQLQVDGTYENPIVTTVEPLGVFYDAEAEHKEYYNQNNSAGYCRVVIDPKLVKLREVYAHLLK